jgi:methylornithine synthase
MEKTELIRWLKSDSPEELAELFRLAQQARKDAGRDRIFFYGFVYFTTWCRNDCAFCYYRRSNDIPRYRKSMEETMEVARQLAGSGVHLLDLTMGEDPEHHRDDFQDVCGLIRQIKAETGLPVMISPGLVADNQIEFFAEAGADFYALYQETNNRELFARLRLAQDFDERMHAKETAKARGMLVEEGILTGVGETAEDLADSILAMGELGAAQMRVMSFVPQEGIPLHETVHDRSLELKIIALMRILYPHVLIPASLDVDGIKGLHDRLNAGANVVTSIIPPRSGLQGVAQSSMDVDEGGRTVEEAARIIRDMGLEPATLEEYREALASLGRRRP